MKHSWMLSLLFSSFTPTLFAGDDWVYYIGGAAGSTFKKADVDYSYNVTSPDQFSVTPAQSNNTTDYSPAGQLQFGVGYREEWFYLGGEVIGQFFDGEFDPLEKTSIVAGKFTSSFNELTLRDFEVAFDLKPGIYLFEEILLYGRVGIGINRLELRNFSQLDETLITGSKKGEDVYPFRLGVGVEKEFFDDITLFIDYVYSRYQNISTESAVSGNADSVLNILSSEAETTSVNRQAVQLGINYYF